MAISSKPFFLLIALLLCTTVSMTIQARKLPSSAGSTLAARLQFDNSYKCWESLIELRSCTGEVILFFLNGEAYLGPGCCRAIRIIEHQCWASMLGALGFTENEGDVLRDYCDSTDSVPPPPSSVQPNEHDTKPLEP